MNSIKTYDCDPFIRDVVPSVPRGRRIFGSPLQGFGITLGADLIDKDNENVVATEGSRALELGFIAPLGRSERREPDIRDMLTELGDDLRSAEDILSGRTRAPEFARMTLKAMLGNELPPVVVAYTGRTIGKVAVADFGFSMAQNVDTAPEVKRLAIQRAGHEPVTVYMAMEDFLAIPPPPLA